MSAPRPLWHALEDVTEALRRAPGVAVATDLDGTLIPIAEHPGEAEFPSRARSALAALAALPRVHVAVLSGRRLDDLREVVGVEGIFLAGASGLETLDAGGARVRHVAPDDELPAELRAELASWCARFEGGWLEDKGPAVAAHYRAVAERFQPAFGAGVRRRVAAAPGRARLVPGKKVLEVLPAAAAGKAAALERWLDSLPGAVSFYFGDDTNDEPVYGPVEARGGFAVTVGRQASKAGRGLPSPRHTVWFLEWLAREWDLLQR